MKKFWMGFVMLSALALISCRGVQPVEGDDWLTGSWLIVGGAGQSTVVTNLVVTNDGTNLAPEPTNSVTVEFSREGLQRFVIGPSTLKVEELDVISETWGEAAYPYCEYSIKPEFALEASSNTLTLTYYKTAVENITDGTVSVESEARIVYGYTRGYYETLNLVTRELLMRRVTVTNIAGQDSVSVTNIHNPVFTTNNTQSLMLKRQ